MLMKDKQAVLQRIRWLSKALDARFTVGPVKVGWDALLGFVPGIGDTVGLVASAYIWLAAYDLGVSWVGLGKIAGLIVIDYFLGLVPLAGDAVDIWLKVNQRAVRIVEEEIG